MSTEGAEIKARRERLGMSISELAAEAGVSRDTLSDMETGRKDFRRLTLTKVEKALDEIERESGIEAPPRTTATEAREAYDQRTQAFLDLVGAYLMKMPEDERLDRIFDVTRYLMAGPEDKV